jgi:uncharacterized protein
VVRLWRGSSRRSLTIGRLGVLVWLGCVLCGAALAQTVTLDTTPPSRAQVLQLMSAMGVQQSVDASLRSTQEKVKAAARAAFEKKDPNADAATLKKLDEVFDSTPLFTFEDISEAIIPVYQKNLSAGDVQAGIDFYSSEAGKRLLEKVPVILRQANEQGGQLVQKKLQAYSEELERKLQAFESEVNSQKPPETPHSKADGDTSKTTGKTTDGTSK